jgi:hypothetical protein
MFTDEAGRELCRSCRGSGIVTVYGSRGGYDNLEWPENCLNCRGTGWHDPSGWAAPRAGGTDQTAEGA